jgi:hypothetical protein
VQVTGVLAAVGIAGAAQGGMFSTPLTSEARKSDSPFWERQASAAAISAASARWWYLPVIVPGLPMGFGNLPFPAMIAGPGDVGPTDPRVLNDPINEKLISHFYQAPLTAFRYRFAIYAFEVRLSQMVQAVWFPLAGVVLLGAGLLAGRWFPLVASGSDRAVRVLWLSAATALPAAGAFVFFANSTNGNALLWKWALTRALEPGLCLAMIAFVLVAERTLLHIESRRARTVAWVVLVALMSFGTLFRVLGYPNFDGVL